MPKTATKSVVNSDDTIRDAILRCLYEVHKKAKLEFVLNQPRSRGLPRER